MLDTYFTSSLNTFVSRANGSDSGQSQASDNLGPYGYTPSFSIAILFLTLFGITTCKINFFLSKGNG